MPATATPEKTCPRAQQAHIFQTDEHVTLELSTLQKCTESSASPTANLFPSRLIDAAIARVTGTVKDVRLVKSQSSTRPFAVRAHTLAGVSPEAVMDLHRPGSVDTIALVWRSTVVMPPQPHTIIDFADSSRAIPAFVNLIWPTLML